MLWRISTSAELARPWPWDLYCIGLPCRLIFMIKGTMMIISSPLGSMSYYINKTVTVSRCVTQGVHKEVEKESSVKLQTPAQIQSSHSLTMSFFRSWSYFIVVQRTLSHSSLITPCPEPPLPPVITSSELYKRHNDIHRTLIIFTVCRFQLRCIYRLDAVCVWGRCKSKLGVSRRSYKVSEAYPQENKIQSSFGLLYK